MQFSKSVTDFLQREPKERQTVSKRYLEPLSDVINGVPHKSVSLAQCLMLDVLLRG